MTDRAHPVQMNASDLWRDYQRKRLCLFPDVPANGTGAGLAVTRTLASFVADLADADLAEFRKRYSHRIFDDKEGAK